MQTLIIFAREPVPGRCKTRLCPPLRGATAAALYECFLHDLLETARRWAKAASLGDETRVLLAHTPESRPAYFATLWPDLETTAQRGATLGERMDNAIGDALERGGQAVLIGSDIPHLQAGQIADAFAHLAAGADVVFGPADDGGYYLVGLPMSQPQLLREVPMSTPTVLADSLALAGTLGLRAALAPPCYDIDSAADLRRLAADLATFPPDLAVNTRSFLSRLRDVDNESTDQHA